MYKYILIAFLLVSCSTSKKSVSLNKTHIDSAVTTHTEAIHVDKIDSSADNKRVDSGQRVTDITYTPFVVDSSDVVEAPVNSIIVHRGKKKTVYVPNPRIIETGTSTTQVIAQTHKSDSSNVVADTQAHVIKDSKIIEKRKFHFGFSMMWLLLLLLLPLLSPKVRAYIKKIILPWKRI